MNIPRLALTAALAAAPTLCSAGDFPIKEWDLGMSYDSLNEFRQSYCRPRGEREHFCYENSPPFRIADRPLKSFSMGFKDGKLVHINFEFSTAAYADIKAAVIGKFGQKAFKCTSGAVQNAMGAQFSQETCRAVGKTGDIFHLTNLDGDIHTGSIFIVTDAAEKAARETAAKRASDI